MFLAKENEEKGMQVVPIKDSSAIRRIAGTFSDKLPVGKLALRKLDGTDLVAVDISGMPGSQWGMDRILGEREEILGVYGSARQDNRILSLGFIVWQPPL